MVLRRGCRLAWPEGPTKRLADRALESFKCHYGRPYGEGFNAVGGMTAYAVAGPLSFSVQGEYQHAPATPSEPLNVLAATAQQDGVLPLPDGASTVNRFQILTASVGLTVKDVRVSFGRDATWLGPGEAGPLLFSDNAAPITALRIDNASPYKVPLLSRWLGPARSREAGVQLNVTALMTLVQVREVLESPAGSQPSFLSLFAGRIADTGRDPVPIMAAATKLLSGAPHLKLIWASPRELLNIYHAEEVGCHIITVTNDILRKLTLIDKDLTQYSLETVKMFYDDAQRAALTLDLDKVA